MVKCIFKDKVNVLVFPAFMHGDVSLSSRSTGRGGWKCGDIIVVKAVLAGFTSFSWAFPEKLIALDWPYLVYFSSCSENAPSVSTQVHFNPSVLPIYTSVFKSHLAKTARTKAAGVPL